MSQCIGCRCCEVACKEQNKNSADLHWRRVGEIEGGVYPLTQRLHLSMGCNHCLDPSCLTGCPVNAYHKDSATGLVLHSAEACIGCQYCIWNCAYGVPQYNSARGVVGKCDMCYGRLELGQAPACVAACPQRAIRIETVNIEEWRRARAIEANAPGLPPAEISLSTTRITLPFAAGPVLRRVDQVRVQPEQPHWPLVFMLVLTQLAAGVFVWAALLGSLATPVTPGIFLAGLAALMAGLSCSVLHLG